MKRISAFVMGFIMLFALLPQLTLPARAEAYSGSCGDGSDSNLTWTFDSETGTMTISGTGRMQSYSSYTNTPWYPYRASITSLLIEDGVTSIGSRSFQQCTSLSEVTIPPSVSIIGFDAFSGTPSMQNVYISDLCAWCRISFDTDSNPMNHGAALWLNGTKVTDLVIPANITSIPAYAFYGCNSIQSVSIPNTVTTIGSDAFFACSNLNGVYISDLEAWCNIDFMGGENYSIRSNPLCYADRLYLNGDEITELVIPESVTTIKRGTFVRCGNISSVSFPQNLTSIEESAFCFCRSLKNVRIAPPAPFYFFSLIQRPLSACFSSYSAAMGF